MNNNTGEILLVTRPLTPPWDEASKNLAYLISKNISEYKFHIMVGKYDPTLPKHITQHLIYKGPDWTPIQKARLVLFLPKILKKNPNIKIVHLLFASTSFNTKVLKAILRRFNVKIVQNLACPPKNKKSIQNFADKIIVYSKFTAKKIGLKNVEIIPPFIEQKEFNVLSEKSRESLRIKWNIGPNDKVLLFPGEYDRLDALGTLWKGFVELKSKIQDAKSKENYILLMACRIKTKKDAIKERKFKQLVGLSSHKDSVIFVGKVPNVQELFQISDLTVFPVKKMEGKFDFPFVLLESLSCGTPILTSDVGALPEIWGKNEGDRERYIFQNTQYSQFAKKIKKILNQKNSNFDVLTLFNKTENIKKYYQIYQKYNKDF